MSETAPPGFPSLSLHDALPICAADGADDDEPGVHADSRRERRRAFLRRAPAQRGEPSDHVQRGAHRALGIEGLAPLRRDRKSTRLNSSHLGISYAVFCLKKKKR